MSLIRRDVSPRVSKFIRAVAHELPDTYDLVLQGSWASGEYHALEDEEVIHSCSDVDFLCKTPFLSSKTKALERETYTAASSCGLELQGISIRLESEMREMWALHTPPGEENNSKVIKSEFIQFWILIGAAEAALLLNGEDADWKRQYHLNKFYLGLWRDISIIAGHHFSSHRETLQFASQWLPSDMCRASYALKLGIETTTPWHALKSVHLSAIAGQLRHHVCSDQRYRRTCGLIDDLMGVDNTSAYLFALGILDQAQTLEGGLSTRKAAITRLSQKLGGGSV